MLSSFPVSSCAFHYLTLLNSQSRFTCLFVWLLWVLAAACRVSVVSRGTFHCGVYRISSCGKWASAACRILLPDQGSDPCPCIVRWIPHQSSFNTELDDAISCLDNVWLNTMDRLICSHPTVAHQASFYLFLATAYPVIAAFYLTHCVLSTKTSFLFQFQTQ